MILTKCIRCSNVISFGQNYMVESGAFSHILCPTVSVSDLIARLPMKGRPKTLEQLGLKMKKSLDKIDVLV